MIQRRTLLKSTAAAVALGAPGLSGLAQQAVTLKFHTFMAPQSNVWLTMHKPWMDKVEKESGGRIKFEGYPAMQLGGTPVQLYDQAKDGVVDIVWTLPGNTAGRFPRIEVFELPFMMNNAEATSKAYWEYVQTVAPDEFKDVQMLALHVHGPGMFHTKDKLIKTADDLRGMKVRGPTRQITKMLGYHRRHAGGHAAARHSRCAVQGHHRWLRDSLGGRALRQGPRTHQVPQRVRQLRRRALHHHLRDGMNKAKYNSLAPDLKKVIDNNSGMATSGVAGQSPAGQRPERAQGGGRPQEHHLHRSPRPTPRNSSARHAWSRWNGCKTWTSAASTARSCWKPPAP